MIETKTIPVPPWKGLHLDGQTPPGGMSKANNVFILPDGSVERRLFQRTLDESPACLASRGLKNVYELRKSDGTRYLFADVDNSDTAISSFGTETITHFASWTAVLGWTYGTGKWTHSTGTTPLVAVGETAVVATTKYRVVVDVTQTPPSSSAAGWAFTAADSGVKWHSVNDDPGSTGHIIWNLKWTHTTGTTALSASKDFTVEAGATYRLLLNVTHTSGTSLSVYIGSKLAGTITATGEYEFITTFVTDTAALRFVPTTNWVGSINVDWFPGASPNNSRISVKKFIDPAGTNIPSNLENYDWQEGLINNAWPMSTWYAEESAQLSQSLAVYIGGVLGGVIQASGEYAYDVTATSTAALTFVPTTAWAGTINSASSMVTTYEAVASTKMKVIGGTVTGTTDYETSWGNVVTNLTAGTNVWPMWATMQDKAYRVDGTNINYYFNNVSEAHTLGVPAPVDAPVTASTTGGELVADAYNVFYTYVKKEGDRYTEGNPSPGSNITIAGTAITVAVIANTDPDITHIRIYRTLSAELGSPAMRAIEVLNATQTVTLILSDDVIGDGNALEYNHDMPNRAMFVLVGGSKLWMLRFPGEVSGDSLLMWSETGLSEYFPAKNYQTFDPADGDKCTGMALLKDNLLIFKRHRTFIINMYSFGKDIISPTIGCIASGSIQSVGVNSAIWLSSEGIMLYDGGEPRNISKFKINSVINFFMANGAEPYIDSCYHSTRRQYHINFLYRTGNVITAQRHFVYALDSDAWTEYVYTSDGGVRYYEINFCLASDSNLNEVILIPYLTSTTGTVAYIYQTDYELPAIPTTGEVELLDTTGADGVQFLTPIFCAVDSYDNVLAVDYMGNIFKISSAGEKSLFVAAASLQTLTGIAGLAYITARYGMDDYQNNCFYLWVSGARYTSPARNYGWIIRVTYTGILTLIATTSAIPSDDPLTFFCLNGDGTILFYSALNQDTYHHHIHKITTPGVGQTDVDYYEFPYLNLSQYSSIEGNNLYFLSDLDDAGPNWSIVKLTDFTGAATPSFIDTQISRTAYAILTILAVSDTELYIYVYSQTTGYKYVHKYIYAAPSGWTRTLVATLGTATVYNNGLFRNSAGEFIVTTIYSIYKYDSQFNLILTSTPTNDVFISGLSLSTLKGSAIRETAFIILDGKWFKVYKIYPDGYWTILLDSISASETAPTMSGVIVDIVSNYEDLGMSNDKRVKRMYLDVESQYATCGAVTIEPDYGVNKFVHANSETTEPSGATSLRPFAHPGRQTWDYTNDQFDSAVEAWQDTRLDLGTQGKKFRYSIKIGDVPSANHGTLRLRVPKISVQIKGSY